MRFVQICSEPESREGRFVELKQLLVEPDYRPGMIDAAISKARQSCQLSQAAETRLRNPLGYLQCKSITPLPHCEEA